MIGNSLSTEITNLVVTKIKQGELAKMLGYSLSTNITNLVITKFKRG